MAAIIEVRDLVKTLTASLRSIGSRSPVAAGRIFAFIGPNGADKTTIKMLT
jgi:ABC-type uncharacterized transport system ATPase subunit